MAEYILPYLTLHYLQAGSYSPPVLPHGVQHCLSVWSNAYPDVTVCIGYLNLLEVLTNRRRVIGLNFFRFSSSRR